MLTPSALAACIPSPTLVSQPGCAFRQDGGAEPAACADLAPAGSPSVRVLSIIVSPMPYDFARRLGIPSMQTIGEAGTPGAGAMVEMYKAFEGPRFEPAGKGLQVKFEARSVMLGGVVDWATLDRPRGTFSTVVVRQIPLHDAPLADADRQGDRGMEPAELGPVEVSRTVVQLTGRALWDTGGVCRTVWRSA